MRTSQKSFSSMSVGTDTSIWQATVFSLYLSMRPYDTGKCLLSLYIYVCMYVCMTYV